jgi:hypothetical protein
VIAALDPSPSRLFAAARGVGWVRTGVSLAALCVLSACRPNLIIGEWSCSEDGAASVIPDASGPVAAPWSTGFENRFCDYTELAGFCYGPPPASFELVTSPVHTGRYAAAFHVMDTPDAGSQTRCVRQGALPPTAYYGAWYYIPTLATNTGNWNLFHFSGGSDLSALPGVMDVSLVNANGGLELEVYGVNHVAIGSSANPQIPIGAWFHVQLYVKRAPDATGEVALYQDGQRVFDVTNAMTDNSSLGQWYVGNLAGANALTPADSTVYVDDITLSDAL